MGQEELLAGLLVLVGGMAVGAASMLVTRSPRSRLRRELRRAPLRSIIDLADGNPGRITGRASAIEQRVIHAPLSGRPCVLFHVLCEEFRPAHSSVEWRIAAEEQRGLPFLVTDDSGRAVIDPTQVTVALPPLVIEPLPIYKPSALEIDFRERHGLIGEHRQFRYSESIVEPDAVIGVLGAGVREPDPDAQPADAYRGPQPMRLRMSGTRKAPLVICDPATLKDA